MPRRDFEQRGSAMKSYFLMILGSAVLSALASVMSPEKWRGYIRLVTGIIILSCVASPVADLHGHSGGFRIPEISASSYYDEDMHTQLIIDELTARIEEDIKSRMAREYGADISARAEININENNEIEGVTRITVRGALPENAKRKLCEIYGVDTIYEE